MLKHQFEHSLIFHRDFINGNFKKSCKYIGDFQSFFEVLLFSQKTTEFIVEPNEVDLLTFRIH